MTRPCLTAPSPNDRLPTAPGAPDGERPGDQRPVERIFSEGNVAEHPLFVLSNREAKPVRRVLENGQGRTYVDPNDYARVLMLERSAPSGHALQRSVVLKAHQEYGFPTAFAEKVLLAIVAKGQSTGLQSAVVPITRYEIAHALDIKAPCQKDYTSIENACLALRWMAIEFRETWLYKENRDQRGRRAAR